VIPGEPFGHRPPRRYAPTKPTSVPRPIPEGNAIVGAFWGLVFTVVAAAIIFVFAIWVSTFFQTEPNIVPCTTEVGGYCIVEP
jgi:hypothetical protein